MICFTNWKASRKELIMKFSQENEQNLHIKLRHVVCFDECIFPKKKYTLPLAIRYSVNHIGLGTKRFIDALGGC